MPLVLALAMAFGAVLIGEATLARFEDRSRQDARLNAQVAAGVVRQLVLRRLEATEVLHRLAQSWHTLRAAGNREGEEAILHELASTANAGSFGFIQVALIERDGWMAWSSVPGSTGRIYLGDREHFRVHQQGLEGLFISRPVLGRVSNRWTVQLTRPLKDGAGDFAGVAVVSMDLYSLSDAMGEVHLGDRDRALLVREDGIIAARSREAPAFINRVFQPADPLRQGVERLASGTAVRQGAGGRPAIAAWRSLPDTPLFAVYILDLDDALAPLAATRTAVRAAVAATVIIAFTVAGLVILAGERRRAALALSQADDRRRLAESSRQLFARRVAGMPAVIYSGDLDAQGGFSLTHVSQNLKRIIGWEPQAFMGGEAWRRLLASDAAGSEALLHQLRQDGYGTQEYILPAPDGQRRWVRNQARLVDRREDGSAEVVGYIADITKEREMQAKAEASGRLATLGEMATGLAHELNQPLAVMSLAAENAARALNRNGAAAVPGALERLERITRQARRARDIVDHLRIFGRQDEGEPEPIRLQEVVEGALLLSAAAMRAAGIQVETNLAEGLPQVMGRLVPLEQALVNLMLNARDAIEEHGTTDGRIWINGTVDGADAAIITVADNGGGIPEEVLQRMFEPFFTTKPPGKGTGLGLPICHGVMRAVGGDISVANGPEGAVFTLRFRTPAAAETAP